MCLYMIQSQSSNDLGLEALVVVKGEETENYD